MNNGPNYMSCNLAAGRRLWRAACCFFPADQNAPCPNKEAHCLHRPRQPSPPCPPSRTDLRGLAQQSHFVRMQPPTAGLLHCHIILAFLANLEANAKRTTYTSLTVGGTVLLFFGLSSFFLGLRIASTMRRSAQPTAITVTNGTSLPNRHLLFAKRDKQLLVRSNERTGLRVFVFAPWEYTHWIMTPFRHISG